MAERIPILVIDDDAELRELLEYNLKLAGFEVYYCPNRVCPGV
jgi:DNA-binding response OmpR family regulator